MSELSEKQRQILERARARKAQGAPKNDVSEFFLNPETGQMTSRELLENSIEPSQTRAAVGGAGQGLTFGALDEVQGGIGYLRGGAGQGNFEREYARAAMDVDKEEYPWTYGVPEVVGALMSSLAAAPAQMVKAGAGVGSRMAGGGIMGAIESALYGFNSGEGGPKNRAWEAAENAAYGAGIGAAAAPVGMLARRGVEAGGDLLRGLKNLATDGANNPRANRVVGDVMRRAGMSADDVADEVARARAVDAPFVTADALKKPGRDALSGVARQPGEAAADAVEFLDNRQVAQVERISAFLNEALGVAETAEARDAALRTARRETANVAYDRAAEIAGPVNLNNSLDIIDKALNRDPILGETALSQGELGKRILRIRSQLQNGGEQLVDFRRVLNVKIDIGNAMKKNPDVTVDLKPIYDTLDAALENASDGYRAANDGYRAASKVIDAIETGAKDSRKGARHQDTTPRYDALTSTLDAEKQSYRTAYLDKLQAQISSQPFESNSVRGLRTPKREAELANMARDPQRLADQIEFERRMFETRATATGGSQTANNQANQADVNGAADIGMIAKALSGQWRGAAMDATQALRNSATGTNEATRDAIARMLMSDAPAEALKPVSEQVGRDELSRRIAALLARQSAYQLQRQSEDQ